MTITFANYYVKGDYMTYDFEDNLLGGYQICYSIS